jgi:eukaryotic-like serine/threonine-protein kinase
LDDEGASDRERGGKRDEDEDALNGAATEQEASPSGARGRSESTLRPGDVVGRFIVHRLLGSGGAGVVYAAHDSELDRTIALKVLRGELAERLDAHARFLREAQALARLSHPNVIAVYDVGAADGRTFIAMEYIPGETLADWVARTRPSWPQVVAVLIKAGRGLAAAHAAGLVHRDFKPANLLVGADGRVVVTDFGLARAVAETGTAPGDDEAEGSPHKSAIARSITASGAIQGTPAYMAPEQRAGMAGDARADQFSFCVTLHEALFGEHPFLAPRSSAPGERGERAPTLDWPAEETAPSAPSEARRVPAWLERAVRRGLRWRPEERHPSMDSLLVALGRVPLLRRRRVQLGLAIGAVVVAGAVALSAAASSGPREETCSGARQQASAVWNESTAARLRASFAATDRPHAQASAARVAGQIDARVGRWAEMHRATCLATLRGEQSPELLDRKMACLGRRLAQVGSLVDLFAHRADEALVDDADELVAQLEPLATCLDSTALLARAALPADPQQRARLAELERKTDRADLELQAGRPKAAGDAARAVLEAGKQIDFAPLAAQAGRVMGRSLEEQGRAAEAREALLRAHSQAERAGDIRLAAHLLIDLVVVVGVREQRHGEARLLGQLAQGALEKSELRGDQAMRARLLEALGSLATDEGQVDRAIELQTQTLAIRRRSSAAPVDVASAESRLGSALASKGRSREARAHYFEALALRRRALGDDHPTTAVTHGNLAATYMEADGNATEARKHLLIMLAVFERMPTHMAYPSLLSNLGTLENTTGNHDQARRYHEAALKVRRRQLGPEHPAVASSLHNLGDVHYETGDIARALSLHKQALAIRENKLGKEHPNYAYTLAVIGEDLRRSGRPREALKYIEQALAILSPRMGKNIVVGYTLGYKGRALADLGRRRDAIPVLERALEVIPPAMNDRAQAAFALARALEPRRPRSRRTRALAEEALQIFTAVRDSRDRDEVASYLVRGAGRRPRRAR